ncbi:MAG: single-stranded-DNA-specific exonuclease RecJ [Eubacteriales bacterium]|nr:single-stranded-DNA-specific exonuclease RecJ [Eubacteriales bacterium]
MKSEWRLYAKKADFKGIQRKFGIDQVIARVMRNRDIITEKEIDRYLNGYIEDMYEPGLMKDVNKAAGILVDKISEHKNICVIGDYDADGICSTSILVKGLTTAGAQVTYMVPHRITDGYGINKTMIDHAIEGGVDTIITCDNGIAAIGEIAYAKEKGLTVIVTDHHAIPFLENEGEKIYQYSDADAVVNPHQQECNYPYENLCGAGVAFKVIKQLFEKLNINLIKLEELAELAAVATVGDLVELKDENRILVKYGLNHIKYTKNIGLRALIEACELDIYNLTSYQFGFVICPCLNASGRLETANMAIELMLCENESEAAAKAKELRNLNEERKRMTQEEKDKAIAYVESSDLLNDNVLVVYLPECHESIAGLIAGDIKERYYKPTIVITDAADGAKGSARSIEKYNMFEELSKCRDLFTAFGGHPMAAGLSLPIENIEVLRRRLNKNQTLTQKELTPCRWIDAAMPVDYVSFDIVNQLHVLEPFGMGNEKPVFADKNLKVRMAAVIGKNRNVLKLQLESAYGKIINAVQFRVDLDDIPKVGQQVSMIYYPDINEYNGRKTLQFVIQELRY